MLTVAGHQTNHLPYGGFFAKMNTVDVFLLVDNTQYVKKEYHNRNRLLLSDGAVHWLTVPVLSTGHFYQKINEVQINNAIDWRSKHLKTLRLNYGKRPYFDRYFPAFEQLYAREWTTLAEFNIAIIMQLRDDLGIHTPLRLCSDIGAAGTASALIVDICRKTGADTYLHGMHSRDYVDFALLQAHGVRSRIQEFVAIPYPQSGHPFAPNLSVIDMLFSCGPDSLGILMAGNTIREHEGS